MKKLMIAVAVVAMACGAQAAAVDWGVEGAKDPFAGSGVRANNFKVYYFAEAVTTVGDETLFARTDALSAIESGDLDFLSKAAGSLTIRSGEAADPTDDVFAKNNTVSGYAVILNSMTPGDATYAYVSSVEECLIDQYGSCPDGIIFDVSGSSSQGAWTQVAPEPTSGLLLLIGMAGLALRRRRA